MEAHKKTWLAYHTSKLKLIPWNCKGNYWKHQSLWKGSFSTMADLSVIDPRAFLHAKHVIDHWAAALTSFLSLQFPACETQPPKKQPLPPIGSCMSGGAYKHRVSTIHSFQGKQKSCRSHVHEYACITWVILRAQPSDFQVTGHYQPTYLV